MNPKIIQSPERMLMGMQSTTHHNQYENIVALWQRFMPQKKKIQNALNEELIALQIYSDFDSSKESFDIWACVEVSNLDNIPKEMKSCAIPEGAYAVFLHKGMDPSKTYQRIMSEWLPNSGYKIDDRPHYQVMGEGYKNGSSESEEDFYVPIKLI